MRQRTLTHDITADKVLHCLLLLSQHDQTEKLKQPQDNFFQHDPSLECVRAAGPGRWSAGAGRGL